MNRKASPRKKASKKTSKKALAAKSKSIPKYGTEAFERRVAELAWLEGLTANAIAKELQLTSKSLDLMRVKRSLKKAHGKFLRLIPSVVADLEDSLGAIVDDKLKLKMQFVVVDDSSGLGGVAVPAKAAETLAEMITEEALTDQQQSDSQENKKGETHQKADISNDAEKNSSLDPRVICNTGGRTISLVVKALQQSPPVLDQSDETAEIARKRLLFVGANAAFVHDAFNQSANFLSVTMAEIFGSEHMAVPDEDNINARKIHADSIKAAKIFLCGAGTLDSSQSTPQQDNRALIVRYLKDKNINLPERAIGDLAFNLLDEEGQPVVPDDAAREVITKINPIATLPLLAQMRRKAKVLLVLDSAKPESKRKVGTAIIRGGYATHVVLGSRLAKLILSDLKALKS